MTLTRTRSTPELGASVSKPSSPVAPESPLHQSLRTAHGLEEQQRLLSPGGSEGGPVTQEPLDSAKPSDKGERSDVHPAIAEFLVGDPGAREFAARAIAAGWSERRAALELALSGVRGEYKLGNFDDAYYLWGAIYAPDVEDEADLADDLGEYLSLQAAARDLVAHEAALAKRGKSDAEIAAALEEIKEAVASGRDVASAVVLRDAKRGDARTAEEEKALEVSGTLLPEVSTVLAETKGGKSFCARAVAHQWSVERVAVELAVAEAKGEFVLNDNDDLYLIWGAIFGRHLKDASDYSDELYSFFGMRPAAGGLVLHEEALRARGTKEDDILVELGRIKEFVGLGYDFVTATSLVKGKRTSVEGMGELADRRSRDLAELRLAVRDVALWRDQIAEEGKSYKKPGFFKKLLGANTYDYVAGGAAVTALAAGLTDALGAADKHGDPNAFFPMAVKAFDATLSRIKGKLPDKWIHLLQDGRELTSGGVLAAVKSATGHGTLGEGQLNATKSLGSGGMANAYALSYRGLSTRIAGKVSQKSGDQAVQGDEQIEDESAMLDEAGRGPGSSEHVLGSGGTARQGGRSMMVMELGAKGDLKDVFKRMGKSDLSSDERVLIAQYLIDETNQGLEALREQGIVHADIKPENIFLDAQLRPKLADFGLASHEGEGDAAVGTEKFLAPEQMEAAPVPASDLWALAESLLVGLTGKNTSDLMGIKEFIGYRKAAITNDDWHSLIRPQLQESLPGLDEKVLAQLDAFVRGGTRRNAQERLGAKGLGSQEARAFLRDYDKVKARQLLARLLGAE